MNSNNDESKVLQIPIEDIIPNRAQPRVVFDDQSLQELADSIKEHGIIQPLVLRRLADKYEIVAGERRYRAAKKAGLTSVPAIISNLNDAQSAEIAIVENIQRKDLTAIEEARSYKAILDKGETTQADLAQKMGISPSSISNKLRLLSLDDEVQTAVLEGKISERHARSLLKVDSRELQRELLHKIINERLTVKQLENEIKKTIGDIPLVNNGIDINDIQSQTKDIEPQPNIRKYQDINMEEEKPNKFFNFLEEASVNMNVDPAPIFEPVELKSNDIVGSPIVNVEEQPVQELTEPEEEIEMLDDLLVEPGNPILAKVKEVLKDDKCTIVESVEDNKKVIKIIIED